MSSSDIFNARDYQHKRFRNQNSSMSSGDSTNLNSIDESAEGSPRVVTPTGGLNDSGGLLDFPGVTNELIEKQLSVSSDLGLSDTMSARRDSEPQSPLLHQPTAATGGLTLTSPLTDASPVRYSLNKGKQGMPPLPNSPGLLIDTMKSPLRNPKKLTSLSLKQRRTSNDSRSKASTGGSKVKKQDPNSYKIFLLLLQPKTKIFELIQLIYSPNNTTIGEMIKMIPANATEEALGSQTYIGLCRPKTQEQLLDMDLLASDSYAGSGSPGMETAGITLGEILVAIPVGYTGTDVAMLSKQILANPKIVKLLKRADPLARKNRKGSHHRRNRNSTSRNRSAEQVHVLEKHDEVEEDQAQADQGRNGNAEESYDPVDKEVAARQMQDAMKKAAEEAAAANAAIPGDRSGGYFQSQLMRSNSSYSQGSTQGNTNGSAAQDASIDESYASWSKSFDASFTSQTHASSICSGVSRRAARRRHRQARRMQILQRSGVAAAFLMVFFYVLDPKRGDEAIQEENFVQSRTPMGFMGLFQCLFLLLTLFKVERLIRTRTVGTPASESDVPIPYMSEKRTCPFLKASALAMKRFKAKYAKRMQRAAEIGTVSDTLHSTPNHPNGHPNIFRSKDDDSLNKKLRGFSLKAQPNDTDTGSL